MWFEENLIVDAMESSTPEHSRSVFLPGAYTNTPPPPVHVLPPLELHGARRQWARSFNWRAIVLVGLAVLLVVALGMLS